MKGLFLALMMVSGAVYAQTTVNTLQVPPSLPAAQQRACVAVGFNADDTIQGFCTTISWGGCSGRGCQPTYHYRVYAAQWAPDTSAIASTFCATRDYHRPGLDAWTYQAGYDASNCYLAPFPGTGPVQIVTIGGIGQYAHYVSASVDGVYGLWNAFGESWVGEF